jgi:hypothetical protein
MSGAEFLPRSGEQLGVFTHKRAFVRAAELLWVTSEGVEDHSGDGFVLGEDAAPTTEKGEGADEIVLVSNVPEVFGHLGNQVTSEGVVHVFDVRVVGYD